MHKDDVQLCLLAGMSIEIKDTGHFHVPKLKDIIELGYSKYNEYVSYLLFDKNNAGVENEELSNFQVFCIYCYHYEDFRKIVFDAIKFFFKEETHLVSDENDVFFCFDENQNRRIDELNFEYIQGLIKKVNFIKLEKEEEDYNPGNERARDFIEKLKQWKREKPKAKETMNLHSIISGLAWKKNDINLFNIFELTIYQLYNGFFYTENIDNYHHTLSGLYAGTVDGKNIKLPEIHWAKIIKT